MSKTRVGQEGMHLHRELAAQDVALADQRAKERVGGGRKWREAQIGDNAREVQDPPHPNLDWRPGIARS
jgi:hypothetical protein